MRTRIGACAHGVLLTYLGPEKSVALTHDQLFCLDASANFGNIATDAIYLQSCCDDLFTGDYLDIHSRQVDVMETENIP